MDLALKLKDPELKLKPDLARAVKVETTEKADVAADAESVVRKLVRPVTEKVARALEIENSFSAPKILFFLIY